MKRMYKGTIMWVEVESHYSIGTEEICEYIEYLQGKYGRKLKALKVEDDNGFVKLNYQFEPSLPFERIRRITGYLSTISTWNEAKLAELGDRTINNSGLEDL